MRPLPPGRGPLLGAITDLVVPSPRVRVSQTELTNEIGRDTQIKIWRKGVDSGIYLDKF